MTWHTGRMAAFDTETTSPTPEVARIVTACVALVGGSQPAQIANWMADPGVPIPEEAAKIHGISTERAQAEGRPAPEVIEQVVAALAQAVAQDIPVVAMNARYDFTVLDREARRHGITPLVDLVGDGLRVIDPYILDKQVDTYRRGKRTLTHLCQHYGVALDGAHDAAADAFGAARVAWRIGSLYPAVRDFDLDDLHKHQITWAAEQAASYQEYLRRQHPNAGIEGAWPLIPDSSAT
ncbi:exonuclease domain-containing protein [Streptantibioticus silvisoli]|uniref:Exonuclease domain-containing protein n=1 Tax=Streptantibioticus silvisoli TaxID=2705255 RepID=A0ABT6W4Z7_9ACTN|nr:exonuclease domain-containing protein [Streptantibioticus silvisoli]MDI5965806.1 exonuclease domain-containing protein [Streptantibioticus silvisoli]